MGEQNKDFIKDLEVGTKHYTYYPVSAVEGTESLPLSLKILVENVLRNVKDPAEALRQAEQIVACGKAGKTGEEIEFMPARVLFQDFTGVPVFVDFAAMREACVVLGGDAKRINPQIPTTLVIDHSVIADESGCAGACAANMELEFHRNKERYEFLKWAQESFDNVSIVPPGEGICHQLNIERFAQVVMKAPEKAAEAGGAAAAAAETAAPTVYFDTLVGTDSHTPTANGLGVLGWGVGGIEAEAAALGQPITTLTPRVVGMHLTGSLPEGVAAMDVALAFAQTLRAKGVVGAFVECFGEGVAALSATQRACISNMTPEYGATATLFPVDNRTLDYLRLTGRSEEQIALVEAYAKAQGTWADTANAVDAPSAVYSEVIEMNLSAVGRSLAGPSRPHERIDFEGAAERIAEIARERNLEDTVAEIELGGEHYQIHNGDLAIAAVTSCTTATDASMMLAAGVLARNAAKHGLRPKPWVKCVLAPGSKATETLLQRAGLLEGLNELGFYTCGFGCMSCIGNSGPLYPAMHDIADKVELASVLSGNRNFEGRISPDVSQNYLAAPATVIAYALAGTMNIDLTKEPLGYEGAEGAPVYLADIWPTDAEVAALYQTWVNKDLYAASTEDIFAGTKAWQELSASRSDTFAWDEASSYVRRAPYFEGMTMETEAYVSPKDARVLALLGDFITTDHISPAGAISPVSPAAAYLKERGVTPADFNTYGSRRGNHEVMVRGTFANVKLQNRLTPGVKGGYTFDFTTDAQDTIFDASCHYQQQANDLVVLAGKMYGSGSSRDWAAKGPLLLGVGAVIAESFERIHRSNLIGMGILPLQFMEGENAATLGLDGSERISIEDIDFSAGLPQPAKVRVRACAGEGEAAAKEAIEFEAIVRVDTPTEGYYLTHGGILPYVLRSLIQ